MEAGLHAYWVVILGIPGNPPARDSRDPVVHRHREGQPWGGMEAGPVATREQAADHSEHVRGQEAGISRHTFAGVPMPIDRIGAKEIHTMKAALNRPRRHVLHGSHA